jgi:hypothetical protein
MNGAGKGEDENHHRKLILRPLFQLDNYVVQIFCCFVVNSLITVTGRDRERTAIIVFEF